MDQRGQLNHEKANPVIHVWIRGVKLKMDQNYCPVSHFFAAAFELVAESIICQTLPGLLRAARPSGRFAEEEHRKRPI